MPSDCQESAPASAPPPPCACRPRLPAAASRLNRHRCLPVMIHNLSGLLAARSKATVPSCCQSRSADEAQLCFCLTPGHYAHPVSMSLDRKAVRQAWT